MEHFNNQMVVEFDSISKNESFARVVVAAFVSRLNPTLEEIAERDRAYLFGAGLMRVPLFHDEVLKWPDDAISYPE